MTIHAYTHKPPPIVMLSKHQQKSLGNKGRAIRDRMAIGRFPRAGEVRCIPIIGMELEVEAVKSPKVVPPGIQFPIGTSPLNIAIVSDEVEMESAALGFYHKRDSSLVNGMEVVTHPRSIEAWKESKNQIKDFLSRLKAMGVRSYDTGRCGLHFHVSKSAFNSPLHAFKFARFWSENFELSFALSKRSESSMAAFASLQTTPAPIAAAALYCLGTRSTRDMSMARVREHVMMELPHHSAVTFTPATVEIRIFRGTMNFLTILSTMELIDHVIQWTATQGIRDLKSATLLKWITASKKNKRVIKMLKLKKTANVIKLSNGQSLEFRHKETFNHLSKAYSNCSTIEKWIGQANEVEAVRFLRKTASNSKKKTEAKTPALNEEDMLLLSSAPILSTPPIRVSFRSQVDNARPSIYNRVFPSDAAIEAFTRLNQRMAQQAREREDPVQAVAAPDLSWETATYESMSHAEPERRQ